MQEKIRVLVIYEILGRPKEHIKHSLEKLINSIAENKGVKIIERKVHEPHLLDESKKKPITIDEELFSTFAEAEMELDNLMLLFSLVLNTLPSNISILTPQELRLNNFDLSSVMSDLTIKLHKYDEVSKALLIEKNQLVNLAEQMDEEIKRLGGVSPVRIEKEVEEEKKTEENIEEKINKENR